MRMPLRRLRRRRDKLAQIILVQHFSLEDEIPLDDPNSLLPCPEEMPLIRWLADISMIMTHLHVG